MFDRFELRMNRLEIDFDRNYSGYTGWCISWNNSCLVSFEKYLIVAIYKAIKEYRKCER